MSAQENEVLVRWFFEEAWGKGNMAAVDEYIAVDYVEHTLPPGSQIGPSTYAGLVRSLSRQAREGRMLPWLVFYDDGQTRGRMPLQGALRVSAEAG